MKYFIDQEFIEGWHKPFLGKRRHHIDLISIGIVAEDGREFYAISNEFNPKDANEWVRANVLQPMINEHIQEYNGDYRNFILDKYEGVDLVSSVKILQEMKGQSNRHIAHDIVCFIYPNEPSLDYMPRLKAAQQFELSDKSQKPEFYGYYADYDWVLFCSLFGSMIDLPKGFPMYCRDLKQSLDEKAVFLASSVDEIKKLEKYPKQINEHNALADARWIKELYDFLCKI